MGGFSSDFFRKDRVNIRANLNALNRLAVNNSIVSIESGAWGFGSSKNHVLIDEKVIKMGSRIFLDVLRHN